MVRKHRKKAYMMKKEITMTEGSIVKQILGFFFPILIGVFFQQLYNTVDAAIVGQFAGKKALAGVGGSSGQILNFLFSFFMGLSSGATVIIAQHYGAREEKKVDIALHTAYTFGIIGGLFLGVAGVLTAKPFLMLLKTPKGLMADSTTYCRILLGGIVFALIYNMSTGILRAAGDSRRPLYILIACCAINSVLDVVFVAVLKMGVFGAAVATVVSQAFSALLVTWLLMKHTAGMKLDFRKLGIDGKTMGRIIHIGLPAAIGGSMFAVANMLVQSTVNAMGINTVAAWTAYGKVDAFWWMINQAYATAITTFVGQNFGAGRYDRIRRGVRTVLIMEMATGAVLSFLFINFGRIPLGLFTKDAKVVDIGISIARLLTPFYAVFAVSEIMGATLRAENRVMVSTIANLIGICVFRIIWVKLIYPDGKFLQIMACYPISWCLITLFTGGYYVLMQHKSLYN